MFGYLTYGVAGLCLFAMGMPVMGGLALVGATVWIATTGVDGEDD